MGRKFSRLIQLFVFCLCALIVYELCDKFCLPRDDASKKSDKVDWHNYTLSRSDSMRRGPGEQGLPVYLAGDEEERSKKVFTENGFCQVVSDKIAIDRAIPDIRHPNCHHKLYLKTLPSVSIVIPVFEEHWTTLLRTISSVINRSPPSILKEIILVDDGSFKPFLKEQLDNYAIQKFPSGFLKIMHHKKRLGLIAARLTGARIATADVLVFLDSHIEASVNWLPPLLEPIALDSRTVVCPFIDIIDRDTFAYRSQDEGARGAFDWILNYKRLPRLPEDQQHPEEPFDNPVMAGGLFAINRLFFNEIGQYDPGLLIWGGEQYELSFKIWMCGGRMVDAPCSRVGHIYRGAVHFPDSGFGNFLPRNYRRVMEVWMDEYAEFVYKRRPHFRDADPGDLTEQHALRRRLQCKSFKWFLTNVAFDLEKLYPSIEPDPVANGMLHSDMENTLCMHGLFQTATRLRRCSSPSDTMQLSFTWRNKLSVLSADYCMEFASNRVRDFPYLDHCRLNKPSQDWRIAFPNGEDKNPIQLIHTSSKLCMAADTTAGSVFLNHCSHSKSQMWYWDNLQQKKAEQMRRELGL